MLDVPNLQQRAFALARWSLREFLFGLKLEPPEKFETFRGKVLIAYSYLTWIYRLFLYLGVAFAVYFHVFKMLGIFLMAIELIWFLSKPVFGELSVWWALRKRMKMNKKTMRTVIIAIALFLLAFCPIPVRVQAQAVLEAKNHVAFFVPNDSILYFLFDVWFSTCG